MQNGLPWKNKFVGRVDFSHKVFLDTLNGNKISVISVTSLQRGLFWESFL